MFRLGKKKRRELAFEPADADAHRSEDVGETRPVRAARLEDSPRLSAAGDQAGSGLPAAAYHELAERPAPEHPDKVDKPGDLKKPSVVAALKRTVREFGSDQCTDLAAALTYYSVLAVFPAVIALASLLGVVNQQQRSIEAVRGILRPVLSSSALDSVTKIVGGLTTTQGSGILLVIGILGALFSASGYVAAFSRAMNRIYEVPEGRPVWKLRPQLFVVTVVAVVLCGVALVILVVSGPVAKSVGDRLGVGGTAVRVWDIAKWPVLLLVVVLVVAMLYYATPNVRQPRFRWISIGAFVAIGSWVLASVGFAFYVANFGSYNKTYGSVAGGVIALLWLWLTNLALLFGAELDSELERSRELQSGIAAEETLQLPLRDERGVRKAQKKEAEMIGRARALRERFTHKGDVGDRPFS